MDALSGLARKSAFGRRTISKPFPDAVKSSTNNDVFTVLFELTGRILWLQGTDIVLYFYVNMKLKIEFIFFCGVQTLQKISTLCSITCTINYCFQPN